MLLVLVLVPVLVVAGVSLFLALLARHRWLSGVVRYGESRCSQALSLSV